MALSLLISNHQLDTSLGAVPLALIVPALIVVVATRGLQGRTLPGWLRSISSASYFMYLFHRPLFLGGLAIANALQAPQPGGTLLVLLAGGVPMIAWISWWGQRLYDRGLRSLGL